MAACVSLIIALCTFMLPLTRGQFDPGSGAFIHYLKPSWFLPLVEDNYPLEKNGSSDYSDYNLTGACFAQHATYSMGYHAMQAWAVKMSDSDGVYTAGALDSAFSFIGSYEQCLRQKATGENFWLPGVGRGHHNFDPKYCRVYYQYDDTTILSTSVCVVEECTPTDVGHMLSVGYNQPGSPNSLPVIHVFCGERTSFGDDVGAIVTVSILGVFVVIIAAATLVDYLLSLRNKSSQELPVLLDIKTSSTNKQDEKSAETDVANGVAADNADVKLRVSTITGNGTTPTTTPSEQPPNTILEPKPEKKLGKPMRALLSFSLYTNLPCMVSSESPPGAYLSMNGVRFLSMCYIVLGHTWVLGTYINGNIADNYRSQFLLHDRWTHAIINHMDLAVEAFFVLSACLTTLSFMKALDRQGGKPTVRQMVLYYVHRYWRLTPVYAIIIMMGTNLFFHLGRGPLLPEGHPDIDNCHKYWWTSLLYINTLYGIDTMCCSWGWYLSLDFQFYVICPLFVFLLYKWKIFGGIFLFLGLCGQIAATAVLESREGSNWWLDIYARPWCRFGSYAIGIALGALMFYTKTKPKLHWSLVILFWCLSITFGCMAIWGDVNDPEGGLNVAYRAVHRDLFALAVAWVIFACVSGYGGIVNHFLSWSFFIPLARLTYVGYLLHPYMIYLTYFSSMRLLYVEDWTMVVYFCGFLMLLLPASLIISVAFEIPFLELEKVILPSRKK